MVAPLFGVLDVQERAMVDVVGPVAVNDPGAVGAVATVTVVVAVLVPFAFAALIVYVVVEVGLTVIDPTSVEVESDPGVIVMEFALVIFHESVLVPAGATIVGDALKEEMTGDTFSTFTVLLTVVVLLFPSVANAQSVVEPFEVEVVFHEME
jgi:hypothetical protein